MAPVTPFWFKQRQARLEEAGPDLYKVTAPNSKEAFIGIRAGTNGAFAAFVRRTADGDDLAATESVLANRTDAWGAAFELYRTQFVV
ncbi:MAG: hypothetical protein L0Y72_20000 [Gemmataceae bacterium]|nr:hypothetical protein [Gemmataceae bacterium]MCI0741320.1 hypothetical protein [Gemmataceae bacterium]